MTDPLVCACGARYFPRWNGPQKCRVCAKLSTRIQPTTHMIDGELIVDEDGDGDPRWLPTLEEIEIAKAEIRRGWSEEEHWMARKGIRPDTAESE